MTYEIKLMVLARRKCT